MRVFSPCCVGTGQYLMMINTDIVLPAHFGEVFQGIAAKKAAGVLPQDLLVVGQRINMQGLASASKTRLRFLLSCDIIDTLSSYLSPFLSLSLYIYIDLSIYTFYKYISICLSTVFLYHFIHLFLSLSPSLLH